MESTDLGSVDRDLTPIDKLRALPLKLTYLTYDARRIFDEMPNACANVNLFDQMIVILWANNYGINKTYSILESREGVSLREKIDSVRTDLTFAYKKKPKPKSFYQDVDLSKVRDEEMTKEQRKARQRQDAKNRRQAAKELAQSLKPRKKNLDLLQVDLDIEATFRLYKIDQAVLISDWDIRLDRFFSILKKLDEAELEEVLAEISTYQGTCNMWVVLLKMEEYLGKIGQAVRGNEEYKPVIVEPRHPMSEESRQKLQRMMDDHRRMRGNGPR